MKTPKEYTQNLKDKKITKSMLEDCLFSVNKRAKNMRDKVREYKRTIRNNRYLYDRYNYLEQYEGKRDMYYKQKETLLTVLKPVCIHKEFGGYSRIRIYDYEQEYIKNRKNFVWQNCFLDRETGMEVWFGDVEDKEHPKYRYYLYYELGEHSFHTPIDEKDINKYDLDVIGIDTLDTHGEDIHDLVSAQFVRKVIALIKTKNYEYVN